MPTIQQFTNADELAVSVAQDILDLIAHLHEKQDQVNIALTGGTVGTKTLLELAKHPSRDSIDYSRVNFWWGDERFLPRDDLNRNANQAKNALLDHLAIPSSNIHEFPSSGVGLDLDEAAVQFEKIIREKNPKFDLILLGVGPDGHVASLFPNRDTLATGHQIIAEHNSPKPPAERLSFSYESLNSAVRIWFIVAGADKENAVTVGLGQASNSLPVGRVSGQMETVWYVDQACSRNLKL